MGKAARVIPGTADVPKEGDTEIWGFNASREIEGYKRITSQTIDCNEIKYYNEG